VLPQQKDYTFLLNNFAMATATAAAAAAKLSIGVALFLWWRLKNVEEKLFICVCRVVSSVSGLRGRDL